ncbi:MAG: ABC transporter permease [Spirochaetaceae bacterium]|nr:ABC transporter permease [Spirochaetaceae bacterium]
MILREDLRMSVRALLGRPAESLLLSLGVALAVGATAAGVTLAGTTRAHSEALLASPRYREIVVSTRAETSTMALPARMRGPADLVLGVDDLERARSVAPSIQHAYLSNPTGFLLGEIPLPSGLAKSAAGAAGAPAASARTAGTAGSVQVFVMPAASATSGPADATKLGSVSQAESAGAAIDVAGTALTADTGTKELPAVSDDGVKQLLSAKDLAGFSPSLVSAPDGPQPQLEYLHGMEVTPEFFAARGLTAAAGSLFADADVRRGEPVLVLGSQLGATLFEDGSALDRQVLSMNRLYRIVGVLAPTGTEVDEHAFAPAPQAADRIKEFAIKTAGTNTSLRFTVTDPAHLDEARAQLAGHFAAGYGEGAVSIGIPRAEAQSTADRYRRLVTIILFLALSALTIAAVNMTNIFYGRAVRRQRSAGILKAVGASMPQVFAVFFLEALIVGAVGGAAGLGLAALLSRLIEQTIGFGALHAGLVIGGVAAAWTLVAACNVLPAAAAARIPAADAIRYE